MWDEITYPFPNLSGATVEIWEWISYSIRYENRYGNMTIIRLDMTITLAEEPNDMDVLSVTPKVQEEPFNV